MKKITSLVITFLLFCSAYADTINSASKNTSVAVYGTQRTSTAIQPWVIPVAVAGAACNSTTDIVAVTSDHSSQLICQSGSWQPVGGGVTGSNTPNGYVRLSNGLIIQWGTASICTACTTYVTLPIAFPTQGVYVNLASPFYMNIGEANNAATFVSKSQIALTSGLHSTQNYRWTAIGY